MNIPQSDILNTSAMNRVFDDTTASYKFYWFLSLLDMYVKNGQEQMPALDIASRMVAYAWYPIEYFKLSFGKGDSMEKVIPEVARLTGITVDDKLEDKNEAISKAVSGNDKVKRVVKKLLRDVPYWFQTPWLTIVGKKTDTEKRLENVIRSQRFDNDCLYSLSESDKGMLVTINPRWENYLNTNYEVLRDFALWNLTLFLQSKNPNVPNISGKLLRPEEREPLTKQKKFWNTVIEIGGPLTCIYTNNPLGRNGFELDHFMPWSFVSHNQNWNLVPADGSFNSSKNNRIPNLDYYLPKLAAIQHRALQIYLPISTKRDAIVNEYFALGLSPHDLTAMSAEEFLVIYRKTFTPLYQMADNLGFPKLEHR